MILMAIALTKRMSGHTQLLTLSDYTQINRYFLESYMGDVMQQLRFQVNNPSELSKYITENKIEDIQGKNLLDHGFTYTACDELKDIAKELKINIKKPKIEIVDPNELEDADCLIDYPQGIKPNKQDGKEKKGLIRITCECIFNKRQYKLEVKYPFCIVFRMIPVLKDFMLFVDHMSDEQDKVKKIDQINILKVKEDKYDSDQDCRGQKEGAKLKPLILLPPLDFVKYNNKHTTGKVYLGNKSVYLNLSGGLSSTGLMNEAFLVSARDLGIDSDDELREVELLKTTNGEAVNVFGYSIPLAHDDEAVLGVMGFCTDISDIFGPTKWQLENFFEKVGGGCENMDMVKIQVDDLTKSMYYSSALKLFGINSIDSEGNHVIVNREVFGKVFARYMVLSFWQPYSSQGTPLVLDFNPTIPKARDYGNNVREFVPQEGKKYEDYMSRVMSGFDYDEVWSHSNADKSDFFMPLNMDLDLRRHGIFDESNFKAADTFTVDANMFEKFGRKWFEVSNPNDNKLSSLEERVGRAFENQEKFKEAVGYPEKFNVNGVVYVKGDLELDKKDMILKYSEESKDNNCSGGVVLVDGDITLGNIYRGKKFNYSDFKLSNNTAEKFFKKWNDSSSEEYVSPDNILTFVSLKEGGGTITLKGNIVIGVQLVNFSDSNSSRKDLQQIKFDVDKPIIFYGSIASNRLNLVNYNSSYSNYNGGLLEFGDNTASNNDNDFDAPYFLYPPVMATSTPPLAVQISENMRDYSLTSSGEGN